MKIENLSGYSTSYLQPIITEAMKANGGARHFLGVRLVITEHGDHGYYSGGTADTEDGGIVDLQLSRGLSYPAVFPAHVASIGDVVVYSFSEEVLLVLTHELAHIRQLRDGFPRWFLKGEEDLLEEGAERVAVGTLREWRGERQRRAA